MLMQFLDELSHNKYYLSVIMPTGCDPPLPAADYSPVVLAVEPESSLCLAASRRRSKSRRGPRGLKVCLFNLRPLQGLYSHVISCFRGI